MGKKTFQKRRPAVGYMTGNFHYEQPKLVVDELIRTLESMDVDLHLYLGSDPSIFLGDYAADGVGFEHHYYSLYTYSNFEDLDILVVAFGGLTVTSSPIEVEEFIRYLPDIPIILLEYEKDVEGTNRIDIDNFGGMRAIVDELIESERWKNIAYINGPPRNNEAVRRREAYEASLKAHGWIVDESMILQGDFSDLIDHKVEIFLDEHPECDAIVCANDSMAESVYRVVKSRGLTIGKDFAVTGFDDIPTARYMEPPLTSAAQDYAGLAKAVAQELESFIAGGSIKNRRIPVILCKRASSGSENKTAVSASAHRSAEERRHLLRNQEDIKATQLKFMLCSLVLRNLIMQPASRVNFFERLGEQLYKIGTKQSYILVADHPRELESANIVPVDAPLRLVLQQQGAKIYVPADGEAPRIEYGEMRRYLEGEKPGTFVDFILFNEGIQYGILTVEIDLRDVLFYHTLSLEIGSGLRYLDIALAEKEATAALAEQNKLLDYAATHDKLTGLFNRAGIHAQMASFADKYGSSGSLVLAMADLDHLKQINDTFGHEAGDFAIKSAAEILENALPNGSFGRTGGDEFMGIFSVKDEKEAEEFYGRVKRECEFLNELSEKPFLVELSLGYHVFFMTDDVDPNEMRKKADEDLYREKKHRRESVIRG